MKSIQLFLANKSTSIPGIIFVVCMFLTFNPGALNGLIPPEIAKQVTGWAALITGIYSFSTSKANDVSGNGTVSNPAKVAQGDGTSKVIAPVIAALLIPAFLFSSCAGFTAFQNSPGVQEAEKAAIGIGITLATGQPEFAALAPIAVSGLTALVNKKNPLAVTGIAKSDYPLIVSTVSAMIPNSTGKAAAVQIANAYVAGLSQPSVPQTPAGANSVLAGISSGLTKGIALASK